MRLVFERKKYEKGKNSRLFQFRMLVSKTKGSKLSNRAARSAIKKWNFMKGKLASTSNAVHCNIVEKAEEKKKAVNKKEEQKLVQKYTQKDDFGTSLGDLLKQALKDQD